MRTTPKPDTRQKLRIYPHLQQQLKIIIGMERDRYGLLAGKDVTLTDLLYHINPKSAANMNGKKVKDLLAKKVERDY